MKEGAREGTRIQNCTSGHNVETGIRYIILIETTNQNKNKNLRD
jgi:hypothetical protein